MSLMQSEPGKTEAGAALQGDVLVVCWLHNVASKLELRSLRSGAVSQEIPLPGKGALRGFSGRREDSEMFFSYSSFTDPGSIFRWTAVLIRAIPFCCTHTIRHPCTDLHQDGPGQPPARSAKAGCRPP